MATLDELIRGTKSKGELVATTVRLTPELHAEVQEFADHFGVSRQEMISTFVAEGVTEARRRIEIEQPQPQGKFHLLNTNRRHSEFDEEWMLSHQKAAAFYSPWKENIDEMKKGDVVFLYGNGSGIVAYGTATGEREVGDYKNDANERYSMKLTDFNKLETPLSAEEIQKILGRKIVFLRTRIALIDGAKLLPKLSDLREKAMAA